jgi:hypothetical protein
LRAKLAMHPPDSPQYKETIEAMQNRLHDAHQLFHPSRNPGLIARLGHLVTDGLGLSSAKKRAQNATTKSEAQSAAERREAEEEAAAAPELDEEETHLAARVKAGLDAKAVAQKPTLWKPTGRPFLLKGRPVQLEISAEGALRLAEEPEGVEAPEKAWRPAGRPFLLKGRVMQEEASPTGELRVVESPRGVQPAPGRAERWKKNGVPVQVRGKWMLPEISEGGRLRFVPLPKDAPEPKPPKISKVPGVR